MSLSTSYQITDSFNASATYNRVFAGDFIRDTGSGWDIDLVNRAYNSSFDRGNNVKKYFKDIATTMKDFYPVFHLSAIGILPIAFIRLFLIFSIFIMSGCAGGLSKNDINEFSVFKPHSVDFAEIEYYALRSLSAYDEPNVIRSAYPDVTRVETIETVGVRYFIETNESARTQTLSIRGTVGKPNIWQDIEIALIRDSLLGMSLHKGFHDDSRVVYEDAKPHFRKDMDIRVTGHSLGAAIAMIISAYLEADGFRVTRLVNFGQPKVTADEPTRALAAQVTRVVDDRDIVPMLPPPGFPPRYRHLGAEVILRPGGDYVFLDSHEADRLSIIDFWREVSIPSITEHYMKNYLANIQNKRADGSNQLPYLVQGR